MINLKIFLHNWHIQLIYNDQQDCNWNAWHVIVSNCIIYMDRYQPTASWALMQGFQTPCQRQGLCFVIQCDSVSHLSLQLSVLSERRGEWKRVVSHIIRKVIPRFKDYFHRRCQHSTLARAEEKGRYPWAITILFAQCCICLAQYQGLHVSEEHMSHEGTFPRWSGSQRETLWLKKRKWKVHHSFICSDRWKEGWPVGRELNNLEKWFGKFGKPPPPGL